jgi:site-specific DNA-methyltransferase (cytosine-N4-specific)
MLTDERDIVLDPFAGSCVTGEVCERLNRRWICVELLEDYLEGAKIRFDRDAARIDNKARSDEYHEHNYYRIPRPGILWNGTTGEPLQSDEEITSSFGRKAKHQEKSKRSKNFR